MHEQRKRVSRRSLLVGGTSSLTVVAAGFAPALAAPTASADVAVLRVAAGLEMVLVSVYERIVSIPQIGGPGAIGLLRSLASNALSHHREHLAALQSVLTGTGGGPQRHADARYQPVADSLITALRKAASADVPAQGARLCATFESVAAQSYAMAAAELDGQAARSLIASIGGVEAQHLAAATAIGTILAAHDERLVSPAVDTAALPPAAVTASLGSSIMATGSADPALHGL